MKIFTPRFKKHFFPTFLCAICIIFSASMSACNDTGTTTDAVQAVPTPTPTPTPAINVAGVKSFMIYTSTTSPNASFVSGGISIPSSTVPAGYTMATGGSGTFLQGVSATQYFDESGNQILKPNWVYDFQVGVSNGQKCANFAPSGLYEVNESFCSGATTCGAGNLPCVGNGSTVDPIFLRLILSNSSTNQQMGAADNLRIKIQYQAHGLNRQYYAATGTQPTTGSSLSSYDNNLDLVWRVFSFLTLDSNEVGSMVDTFIPPWTGYCSNTDTPDITHACESTGGSKAAANVDPKGNPTVNKSLIVPLSSMPGVQVIQFSRTTSAEMNATSVGSVTAVCTGNQTADCLGTRIYSVTVERF